jgi:hypothetical protein
MWIIASIPFWLLGLMCLVVAVVPFTTKAPATNGDVVAVLGGLAGAGLLFVIAAKVAS